MYTNGKDYYFLCLINISGNVSWDTACNYTWTITIQGKTVTAKIPTRAQVEVATQANRATGFHYWTSTRGDSRNIMYVYSDGGIYGSSGINLQSAGAVPLAVISL